MALIKFGGGVVDASGSIGGTVFSRNSSGNYMRARTKPVNPNTPRQNQIRNAMQVLSDAWSNLLSPAQRTAWGLYAANVNWKNRLGETILISGRSHFLRSNLARVYSNLGRRDDGPTNFTLPGGDSAFNVVADVGDQELVITFDDTAPWCSENSAHMVVSMSQPKHSAVNFIGGPFRVVGTVDGSSASAATSPATLSSLPFVIGNDQVVAVKARKTRNDGRLSEFFRDSRTPTTA